ncbi:LacI family transcriptional regulator [Verminephrobacter aporrectodeae subsp. tuberculatae]|uniref:LacI family DNA-binding transcriptional regulator n=1 Tax=Verminephrobacter aporrectodeae TaxID=1110389 RepID=UPI002243B4D1|nr:LacI family DNA-binding transcriptional regulator [Verminephrobacter aporrectodeae]MCW8164922.1 LacI family transcriptional regulator [Verminephrobacter aporrectodeae subsp. tuberculatae]MCW8168603.1 LacI family transcriptional regulator [Verminephrobacter aporrectodeae subsp. tuberculatae]MCW8199795.1 LacI family transcriptional regulator [Verminephrobacter aporrectodeae subsp. tuberculatae]MCW8208550.1 LacI family transcriptional regulator [Verminephrobacter aporrectodeae subsp. tuberculat
MSTKPSINAVAHQAGVSIATVSRVLTGSKPVSAETRLRVQAAVQALGYRANPFGRGLSTGRSGVLLMLVPDFANPYYAEIVRGAVSVARQRGYTVLPVDLEGSANNEASLQVLQSGLPDGVINLVPVHERAAWAKAAEGRPWVHCSEFQPDEMSIPHVSIDHRQAATDAVQYLLNRGHRRIALVNSDERFLYARQRREGYELALRRADIAVETERIRTTGTNSYAAGSLAAAALLSLVTPPTAVFAVSDTLAIGVIKGLRRAGRRVPEDTAVVGFDDVPIAEVFEPALTTVGQPMQDLGAAAVVMLLGQMEGQIVGHRILPHRLVVRESA